MVVLGAGVFFSSWPGQSPWDSADVPQSRKKPPPAGVAAATKEEAGGDLSRLTLTDKAVERLSLATAKVTKGAGGALEVPYGALIYDATGKTWVYTNPEPRTTSGPP